MAGAAPIASPRFAKILAARRGRFNAQFAEARRYRPALEANDFSIHLTQVLAPIVEAVAERRPQQAGAAAEALYDLSLDLVSREFLGPKSRYPAVVAGWRELLAAAAGAGGRRAAARGWRGDERAVSIGRRARCAAGRMDAGGGGPGGAGRRPGEADRRRRRWRPGGRGWPITAKARWSGAGRCRRRWPRRRLGCLPAPHPPPAAWQARSTRC